MVYLWPHKILSLHISFRMKFNHYMLLSIETKNAIILSVKMNFWNFWKLGLHEDHASKNLEYFLHRMPRPATSQRNRMISKKLYQPKVLIVNSFSARINAHVVKTRHNHAQLTPKGDIASLAILVSRVTLKKTKIFET